MTMAANEFQLVALDLDGTVLDNTGRVSQVFEETVGRLSELGVRTVLCSGRRWRRCLPILEEVVHADPVAVCSGGALIKEVSTHRTLHVNPLGSAAVRGAVGLFRRAGLMPVVLLDRPLEARELLVSELDRARARDLPSLHMHLGAVEYYRGDLPALEEPVLGVFTETTFRSAHPCAAWMRGQLGDAARVIPLSHSLYGPADMAAVEVYGPTATKWDALSRLLASWRIPPKRVVAIGDDMNDVPMLKAAGLSFAMANAVPEVKAAADRLTADNECNGVVLALRSVFPLRSQGGGPDAGETGGPASAIDTNRPPDSMNNDC